MDGRAGPAYIATMAAPADSPIAIDITPAMIEAGGQIIADILAHDPFMGPGLAEHLAELVLRRAASMCDLGKQRDESSTR